MPEQSVNRYKIIVNPISGRGNGERIIPALQESLRKQGVYFDLVCTERPFHASDLARQAVVGTLLFLKGMNIGNGSRLH